MREFTYIYRIALAATLLTMIPGSLRAELTRDYMTIVGSATVYPFSQRVIERFIKRSAFKTPRVQTTGSGGGLMLFCMGTGVREPDITYASRRITRKEFDICRANGVREIVEIKIGDDGIVIANSKKAPAMDLSLRDIYLALAKEVPDPEGSKTMVANPYKTWKDVNGSLPDRNIEIMGRTRGSSTFYAFSRLALESGCRTFDWIRALKKEDPLHYKELCRTVREDGVYIKASDEDNQTLQKLLSRPDAFALFSFSFLDKNRDTLRGSVIDGVKPDFDTIADDSYPISRPLYIYVKKAHVGVIPGIRELLAEYTSDRAWGDDGYLSDVGLIPMPESERRKYASDAENLVPMTR
jgi:phosphate transport system substrate-binding protein